ncbi:hypothetical protein, partial [Actinomyces sp.]|uniref:hypothetical protein n=1 Tax=Actinomyces sp. TaxID=29317 RepID=UPI0026DCB28F
MAQGRKAGDGSRGGGHDRTTGGRASSARAGATRRTAPKTGGEKSSGARAARSGSARTASSRQAPRGQARAGRTVTTQDGRPGRRPARTARTGRGQTARSAARASTANRRPQAQRPAAVRRPEPPRRPRYWLRRLVVLVLGVVLLAGISTGILSAAVWARDTIRAQDDAAAAHVATTYANPVDCKAEDLDVSFTSPDSVPTGAGVTLNVTVNNTGSEACLLDLGGEHIGALVTSGGRTVWESTVCPFTPTSRRLLVAPGDAAAATIIWDGNVASTECAPVTAPTVGATASATAAETATAAAEAT